MTEFWARAITLIEFYEWKVGVIAVLMAKIRRTILIAVWEVSEILMVANSSNFIDFSGNSGIFGETQSSWSQSLNFLTIIIIPSICHSKLSQKLDQKSIYHTHTVQETEKGQSTAQNKPTIKLIKKIIHNDNRKKSSFEKRKVRGRRYVKSYIYDIQA